MEAAHNHIALCPTTVTQFFLVLSLLSVYISVLLIGFTCQRSTGWNIVIFNIISACASIQFFFDYVIKGMYTSGKKQTNKQTNISDFTHSAK